MRGMGKGTYKRLSKQIAAAARERVECEVPPPAPKQCPCGTVLLASEGSRCGSCELRSAS
jgi:hypothetical protein